MGRRKFAVAGIGLCAALGLYTQAWSDAGGGGDAKRGQAIYQACQACHAVDENDIGPMHRGVVGRRSASVPGYAYSAALRASGIVWSEAQLDRWLADPGGLVPGTKMYFQLPDAQARADVIAYLREQR